MTILGPLCSEMIGPKSLDSDLIVAEVCRLGPRKGRAMFRDDLEVLN